MNKNNLLIIIILIFIGIFVIAKTSDFVSTWAVKSKLYPKEEQTVLTSIVVLPKEIQEGQFLNIEIIPGSKGASRSISIYKIKPGPDLFIDSYRFCRHEGSVCKKNYNFKYKFPIAQKLGPGNYYIDVYDLGREVRVRSFFKVSENPKYK